MINALTARLIELHAAGVIRGHVTCWLSIINGLDIYVHCSLQCVYVLPNVNTYIYETIRRIPGNNRSNDSDVYKMLNFV